MRRHLAAPVADNAVLKMTGQSSALHEPLAVPLDTQRGWPSRKAESRRRILTAARKLFVERGYHGVRTLDIANEAGIGQGSFYFHFADKLECFLAFAEDAASELSAFTGPYLASGPSQERIRGFLQGAFDYSLANPGVLKAIVADIGILSIDKKYPYLCIFPDIMEVVEELKGRRFISQESDSRFICYVLAGAVRHGDILISHSPAKKDEILQNILSFLCRGMSPRLATFKEESLPPEEEVIPPLDARLAIRTAHEGPINFSQKKLANRRKILDAARRLFTEQGYDNTSPVEIARLAGVGVGTLYAYFEDKLACYLAFIDEVNYELTESASRAMAPVSSFPEIVNAMLRNQFEYSRNNPGVFRALTADIRVLSKKDKITSQGRSDWTCQFIDNLKRLGKIEPRFDTRLLAYMVGSVLAQADAYITDYPDKRERTIEHATRFVIHAIRIRRKKPANLPDK